MHKESPSETCLKNHFLKSLASITIQEFYSFDTMPKIVNIQVSSFNHCGGVITTTQCHCVEASCESSILLQPQSIDQTAGNTGKEGEGGDTKEALCSM